MNQLTKHTVFESNTAYIADGKTMDIYLEDTVFCDNQEALASSRVAGNSCQVAFLLEGIKNTVLDFGGATVLLHGRIVPFLMIDCENVTVKNLKIDYDRPFFTQADILSVTPTELRMKICDGFDYEVRDGFLYAKSETWEKCLNRNDCLLWPFDKTGKRSYGIILALFGEEIFPNENPPLPIRHLHIREEDGVQIVTGEFPPEWDTGDGNNVLLITHEIRDKNTFVIIGGSDITIQSCMLIHGAAMGICGMHTNNLTIDRFDMLCDYNGNGRYVTNNADAVHLFNCSGKVVMKNCVMEGLLDDTLNVHGNYLSVKQVEDRVISLYPKAAGLKIDLKVFNEGDRIGVNRGSTMERVTELLIRKIEIDREAGAYLFTVDGDTDGIRADDTVENLSAQPDVLITDCDFGLFRGTMRLQSRGHIVMQNCRFRNKDLSVLFSGDTTYWYESSPVTDVEIRNCIFENVDCGARLYTGAEVEFTERENFYHRGIRVEDCTFHGSGEIANVSHVDGFTMKNNRYDGENYVTVADCDRVDCDLEVR